MLNNVSLYSPFPRTPNSFQGFEELLLCPYWKSTAFLEGHWKTSLGSRLAGCPVLTPSSTWVESVQVLISSSSRVKAMPPPGKVPRKENLGLQCEWGSCSFVCSAMEEFCEHVTQHLQQHLQGSGEEEEEEEDLLGKEAGHRKGKEPKGWWKIWLSLPQREKAASESGGLFS